MDRAKKAETIKSLREKFSKASSMVILDYRGLTVEEVNGLRREFKKNLVEYKVIKNSLARIALEGTSFKEAAQYLKDTTAVALAKEDPTSPARVAIAFSKSNEKLKIRAGALPGSVLSPADVKSLALLPSRDEVRAKMLSLFVTSQRSFLYLLNAAQRQFLGVLNAYNTEREKAV